MGEPKLPSQEEIRKAQSDPRIRPASAAGLTAAQISRALGHPLGAVELVLASAADSGTDAKDDETAGDETSSSAGFAEVLGAGRPSKTGTSKLLSTLAEDQLADIQARYAKARLEDLELSIAERRARLESHDTPSTSGNPGTVAVLLPNGQLIHTSLQDADAVRATFARGEREDRVAQLERELAAEREKGREDRFTRTVQELDRKHVEELRSLEARLTHRRSESDIELDRYAAQSANKSHMESRFYGEVADAVHDRPRVARELGDLLHDVRPALTPALQQKAREALATTGDRYGTPIEQSYEHLAESARRLEAGLTPSERDAVGALEGMSRTIPQRAVTPTSNSEAASTESSGVEFSSGGTESR